MVNHYEVHVILLAIEHQPQVNILHQFIHYSFFEVFIKLRGFVSPFKNYSLEAFVKSPNLKNYLNPSI